MAYTFKLKWKRTDKRESKKKSEKDFKKKERNGYRKVCGERKKREN